MDYRYYIGKALDAKNSHAKNIYSNLARNATYNILTLPREKEHCVE